MKRFVLLLGLVLAMSLVFVGAAYANFGPHGGYITDTDSCAGCHRAHTSFSTVTFDPKVGAELLAPDEKPSALLVGSAATMTEFCNACHGQNAPGASTNVVQGIFDSGPSGSSTQTVGTSNGGVTVAYETNSSFNGPLNGGGFSQMPDPDAAGALRAVSSAHTMEATNVLWGAGSAANQSMNLNCAGCHDPHGSSNYRLLKDSVNGVTVGGYNDDDTANGMVTSVEQGYPVVAETAGGTPAGTGWLKHEDGQLQMAGYKPDYTGGTKIKAGTAGSSLSTWCSACHTRYNQTADTDAGSNYGSFEGGGAVGTQVRHRHPVDITLLQGDGTLQINAQADGVLDSRIPLEEANLATSRQNQIGCLTCHYAHGSVADMGGWANAHLVQNAAGTWVPSRDTTPGVEPDKADTAGGTTGSSALLRADKRGVCERCHDK